jgi:hypothetical protein
VEFEVSYCIAQPRELKTPKLFEVRQNGGRLMGTLANEEKWSGDSVEIHHRDIFVNLGDNPRMGTCYNVWVEPVVNCFNFKGYGSVFNYVPKMPEVVKERLSRAFPAALARVRRLGPQCDWEMLSEIRNPKDKKDGLYHYKPRGRDILTYYNYPQEGRAVVKTVGHELFHGVWYRHLSAESRAKWIDLFERCVSVRDVSPKMIQRMLRDANQSGGLRVYLKEAEPEEKVAFGIYMNWAGKVHKLKRNEMVDLVGTRGTAPIPDTHLHRSDIQCPLVVHNKESATELFAEAGSAFIVGDLNDRTMEKMLRSL